MGRRILAAICAFVLCAAFVPAFAHVEQPAKRRAVRVAVTEFAYFSEKDERGNRTGIFYDYLRKVSKYAGWDITYVDGGMEEILSMVASGQADLIGYMDKNESTMAMYDFPEFNSGYVYTCLITKADKTEFIPSDYESLDGATLAVYDKAAKRKAELADFTKSNALSFEVVPYDDYETCMTALDRGAVDLLLARNVDLGEDEKIVARFAPTAHYFAVTKGNSAVMRELNQALEMINSFEPDFNNKLYYQYFQPREKITEFTQKERHYIEENPVIRAAFVENARPYAYYNQKEKAYRGVCLDLLRELGRISGFTIEFVPAKNLKAAMDLLQGGQAELFVGPFDEERLIERYGVVCSVPYLSTQTVIVTTGKDEEEGIEPRMRVAVLEGNTPPQIARNVDVAFYATPDEAIGAVRTKQADYATLSYLAAASYTRREGQGSLSIAPLGGKETEFTLAYGKSVPPLLTSILDKAVFSMEDGQLHTIMLENTVLDSPVSLNSYLYYNPWGAVGFIAFLSAMAILVIFLVMRIRLKYTQKTAMLGEAYRLVGELTGEYLFEYDFENEEMKLPDRLCEQLRIAGELDEKGCANQMHPVVQRFKAKNPQPRFFVDFECTLKNGQREWFRATCAVVFANNKPVRGLGKIVSAQAERMEKRRLEMLANTDDLTGLYVKSYCEAIVDEYLENAPPEEKVVCIMMDMDHFKTVNDTVGHLGGDQALRDMAGCLKMAPENTVCGRFGGDEFFIFVKNAPETSALEESLKKLCAYMDRELVFEGARCRISISAGATYQNAGGATFHELLRGADQALYTAKKNGRNGYYIA